MLRSDIERPDSKGIKTQSAADLKLDWLISNALIQKGLRPYTHSRRLRCLTDIERPDSKGIKTGALAVRIPCSADIERPDSKGIKTRPAGRPSAALLISNALIQKGLRQPLLDERGTHGSDIERPDSKGIKTVALPRALQPSADIERPDSKGIKTSTN